jgi:hypothetical protein
LVRGSGSEKKGQGQIEVQLKTGVDAVPPAWGRVDYLKVTVWATPEHVKSIIEGFADVVVADRVAGWVDRGRAGRVRHTWELAGVLRVLEYGELQAYVSIELRGEACGLLGNAGVAELLGMLHGLRWRASRCDFAWDGVPFDVQTVKRCAKAGQMNSRTLKPEGVDYWESDEGTTVYVAGEQGRAGEQFLRVYDRRGPVRFELELKGDAAAAAIDRLHGAVVEGWPAEMLAVVRRVVDFVEVGSGGRVDRGQLLPWWLEFVQQSRRASTLAVEAVKRARGLSPVQRVERAIERAGRALEAGRRAYGDAWLLGRIGLAAVKRWGPEDEQLVADLAAGVVAVGVEAPF